MLSKSINIIIWISCLFLPSVIIAQINCPTYKLPKYAITRLGKGSIGVSDKAIAVSPNGDLIAVATAIGIWLYDAKTYHTVDLLIGHTNSVESVTFSPNGKILVSASFDQTVKLWSVTKRIEIATL